MTDQDDRDSKPGVVVGDPVNAFGIFAKIKSDISKIQQGILDRKFSDALSAVTELRADLTQVELGGADGLKNDVDDRPRWLREIYYFFSTGLFFMVFGGALLLLSYLAIQAGVHASFCFVLMVLSVAILLFGTGTQSFGEFQSSETLGKYNVMLAGGAGALALIIGWGMIYYGSKMPDVFGIETKRLVVVFQPQFGDFNQQLTDDTVGSSYFAEFTDDLGKPLPSEVEGNTIQVFLPYYEKQLNSEKPATPTIKYKLSAKPRASLGLPQTQSAIYRITLSGGHLKQDAGLDLPVYSCDDKDAKLCEADSGRIYLASLANNLAEKKNRDTKSDSQSTNSQEHGDMPTALRGGGDAQ